jgi:hypothetical protein
MLADSDMLFGASRRSITLSANVQKKQKKQKAANDQIYHVPPLLLMLPGPVRRSSRPPVDVADDSSDPHSDINDADYVREINDIDYDISEEDDDPLKDQLVIDAKKTCKSAEIGLKENGKQLAR